MGNPLDMDNVIHSEILKKLVNSRGCELDEQRFKEQLEVINRISRAILNGESFLLEAPTGFGKTESVLVPFIYNKLYEHNVERLIHVVPTRSLLRALFFRYLSSVFALKSSNLIVSFDHGDLWFRVPRLWFDAKLKGVVLSEIPSYLSALMYRVEENITKASSDVRALLELREILGHSYLTTDINVVTIDTFSYPLLSQRSYGDYMLMPLNMVAHSLVFMDEVHLLQDAEMYTFEVVVRLLRDLHNSGVPFVLASATLPTVLENEIVKKIPSISIHHAKWKGKRINIQLVGSSVSKKEIIERIRRYEKENATKPDVLVVLNTVRRAVEVYEELLPLTKEYNVLLMHGRFSDRDRIVRECMLELKARSKRSRRTHEKVIVIATQVAECGLDYPFDMVITELAPVDALIQRTGRIRGEGEAYVYNTSGSEPYSTNILNRTKNCINSYVVKLGLAPRSVDDAKELLDHVYDKFVVEDLMRNSKLRHEWRMRRFYEYINSLNALRNPAIEVSIRPNTYIEILLVPKECINELKRGKVSKECCSIIGERIRNGHIVHLELSKKFLEYDENKRRFVPSKKGKTFSKALAVADGNALRIESLSWSDSGEATDIVTRMDEYLHPFALYVMEDVYYDPEKGLVPGV